MRCPYCRAEVGDAPRCPACDLDLSTYRRPKTTAAAFSRRFSRPASLTWLSVRGHLTLWALTAALLAVLGWLGVLAWLTYRASAIEAELSETIEPATFRRIDAPAVEARVQALVEGLGGRLSRISITIEGQGGGQRHGLDGEAVGAPHYMVTLAVEAEGELELLGQRQAFKADARKTFESDKGGFVPTAGYQHTSPLRAFAERSPEEALGRQALGALMAFYRAERRGEALGEPRRRLVALAAQVDRAGEVALLELVSLMDRLSALPKNPSREARAAYAKARTATLQAVSHWLEGQGIYTPTPPPPPRRLRP